MRTDLPSLQRNFIWTLGGNVVYTGCQWGMLIALAKLGNATLVGQFALALAITAPVFQFTSLQLRTLQATDARQEYRFSEYFALRLASTFLGLAVIAGLLLTSGYHSMVIGAILAMAAAKAIESISDVIYGLLQQHEQMEKIARSMILKGCLSLGVLAAAISVTKNVVLGVVCMALAWLLVLAGYDLRCGLQIVTAHEFRPSWNRRRIGKLIWLSLPMGLVLMLLSLNVNIPRYFIERVLGERQLGIFAAMASLMQAGGMVMNALGNILSPRLAKYYAEGNTGGFRIILIKLLGFALAMGMAGILVAYFLGRPLLTLVYRPEYAQHVNVFTMLMIAAAVSYIGGSLGYAVSSIRCFAGQLPVNLVSSLLGLVCSYFAIAEYGLYGAALAVLVVAAASAAGNAILLIARFSAVGKIAAVAEQPSAG